MASPSDAAEHSTSLWVVLLNLDASREESTDAWHSARILLDVRSRSRYLDPMGISYLTMSESV